MDESQEVSACSVPAKVNWLGKGEAAERLWLALCPSPGTASLFPGAGATSFQGSE